MAHNLTLSQPQTTVDQLKTFITTTFQRAHKSEAVIAVSGGIDSALSLTLLTQALGAQHILPILLPYGKQHMEDAKKICEFNNIPSENITSIDITSSVDSIVTMLDSHDPLNQGNIMARTRMIAVYDLAKKKNALVCGTENKSEHYLGYFTRFGDAASDLEPISTLYKTQIRQLAQFLNMPSSIIEKSPSAGLWENQTDENELGFTYEDADKVLHDLIDNRIPEENLAPEGVSATTLQAVLARVHAQAFKLQVPYTL